MCGGDTRHGVDERTAEPTQARTANQRTLHTRPCRKRRLGGCNSPSRRRCQQRQHAAAAAAVVVVVVVVVVVRADPHRTRPLLREGRTNSSSTRCRRRRRRMIGDTVARQPKQPIRRRSVCGNYHRGHSRAPLRGADDAQAVALTPVLVTAGCTTSGHAHKRCVPPRGRCRTGSAHSRCARKDLRRFQARSVRPRSAVRARVEAACRTQHPRAR